MRQAIVFDPSAVTGFAAVGADNRREGCECRDDLEEKAEARFLRVYERREVLANLRLPHKVLWPPERHVQEVRFNFYEGRNPVAAHNMSELAGRLRAEAESVTPAERSLPWFASKDPRCTAKLIEAQEASCRREVDRESKWFVCPS